MPDPPCVYLGSPNRGHPHTSNDPGGTDVARTHQSPRHTRAGAGHGYDPSCAGQNSSSLSSGACPSCGATCHVPRGTGVVLYITSTHAQSECELDRMPIHMESFNDLKDLLSCINTRLTFDLMCTIYVLFGLVCQRC